MMLSDARQEMDAINRDMLRLFVRRMELSGDIAKAKRAQGLPVRDPAREEAILFAMRAGSPEAIRPYVAALFETLFALSRTFQEQRLAQDEDGDPV